MGSNKTFKYTFNFERNVAKACRNKFYLHMILSFQRVRVMLTSMVSAIPCFREIVSFNLKFWNLNHIQFVYSYFTVPNCKGGRTRSFCNF